ncbi:hypothetical protein GE09DRAFT_417 [Coniochaeta sp. 2T2.1]|nr:hypothetical protein GE09DRAFT_417 [Coniochaeta sp. 2T2.1]
MSCDIEVQRDQTIRRTMYDALLKDDHHKARAMDNTFRVFCISIRPFYSAMTGRLSKTLIILAHRPHIHILKHRLPRTIDHSQAPGQKDSATPAVTMCLATTHHISYHDVRTWVTLKPFSDPGVEDYVSPVCDKPCACGRGPPAVPSWISKQFPNISPSSWKPCPDHQCCTALRVSRRCHWAPGRDTNQPNRPCANSYYMQYYYPCNEAGQPYATDQWSWTTPSVYFTPETWYISSSVEGAETTPSDLSEMAALRRTIFESGKQLYDIKKFRLRVHCHKATGHLDQASKLLALWYAGQQVKDRFDKCMARARKSIENETKVHRAALEELQTVRQSMGALLKLAVRPDEMTAFYKKVTNSNSSFAERFEQSEGPIDGLRAKCMLLEGKSVELRFWDDDNDEPVANETRGRKRVTVEDLDGDDVELPTKEWVRGRAFSVPKCRLRKWKAREKEKEKVLKR